jgi:hypothetical protein
MCLVSDPTGPYAGRMRSKALFPLMVAAILALSPHTGAAAATVNGTDDAGSSATRAPMAVLSSFTADTRGATIIGGTRTVTVHSFAATGLSASVDLEPAPCDCTISHIAASHGTISGSIWTIEALAGGRTATLTVAYSSQASGPIAIRAHSREPASAEDSTPGDIPVRTVVRSRHIAL